MTIRKAPYGQAVRRFGCGSRRIRETGKASAQINFKGKKLDRQTAARQELETGVEDGAVCREILRAIGYVPVAPEVRKERRMLRKDQVTACLDRVDGLGDFPGA